MSFFKPVLVGLVGLVGFSVQGLAQSDFQKTPKELGFKMNDTRKNNPQFKRGYMEKKGVKITFENHYDDKNANAYVRTMMTASRKDIMDAILVSKNEDGSYTLSETVYMNGKEFFLRKKETATKNEVNDLVMQNLNAFRNDPKNAVQKKKDEALAL